jgi:hypothetical protein
MVQVYGELPGSVQSDPPIHCRFPDDGEDKRPYDEGEEAPAARTEKEQGKYKMAMLA